MRSLADSINAACANPKLITGGDPSDFGQKKILAAKLKEKLRSSRRFFVDDEVTRAAVRLGLHHPNILLEMLHRARTPFEKVWLEWPVAAQVESSNLGQTVLEGAAERTGCFIERMSDTGFRISAIEGPGPNTNRIGVTNLSIFYDILTPIEQAQPQLIEVGERIARLANVSFANMNRTLIGSAYHSAFDEHSDPEEQGLRRKYCDDLSKHAAWMVNPMMAGWHRDNVAGKFDHKKFVVLDYELGRSVELRGQAAFSKSLYQTFLEHSGIWRTVISMLALINAQTFTQQESYRYGKTRSQSVAGHIVPYLEHLVIKLKLPRKVVEERMVRMLVDSIPKRQQEILGSFRQWHKRGDPNCNHPYIDVTPTRKRCPLCGHAIWWVDDYLRGDATVGHVIKDRVVTGS